MKPAPENPIDVAALQALLAEKDAQIAAFDQYIAGFKAQLRGRDFLIEKLKHQLAGMRRHWFGSSSEALDQLELTLEEEEIAQAAETSVEDVAESPVPNGAKRKPKRKPLPSHLPRNETVLSPGDACADCGGRLKHLGEDVTEGLEYVPGRFVVNRIIRPRMACACCEAFQQAPLPSRPIERGRPGPGLLAHVLVSKYCDHLPLYRQSQIYGREGIELERSTLADWVGKATSLLEPLANLIARYVLQGQALFADDTPVKLLSPGSKRTKTARVWAYVRDERPWQGETPPCAWYQFTRDRKGDHPVSHLSGYKGWIHADGYTGFNGVFGPDKASEMACMAHIRRKFVDIYKSQGSPIAEEAIKRIAELYAVEKQARGQSPEDRAALRQADAKPVFDNLEVWLRKQLPKLPRKSPLADAIRYALDRLPKARPYLDNGFLEIDNNSAERSMRPIGLGRKNYLFMGSEGGGKSAAIAYTLIETAKLNGVDPQAWLTDVLGRIADYKITKLDDLLPWRYAATAA